MHTLEVTRAIRFQAFIPLRYWGHYILAVVYLINRMPSSIIGGRSSYVILYGRKPQLDHLRVLDCLCYAKNVHESHKLLSRTNVTVHMVYSDVQKGYILYNLDNHVFL